jgi:ADP-heptose:LPS heptosyltransferase
LNPPLTPPALRIGIYRTSSIGDVVLATAVTDLLNGIGLPAEITWAGRPPASDLISAAFPSVRIIELGNHSSAMSLGKAVREFAGVHVLIDLQVNIRSNLFSKLLWSLYQIPTFAMRKHQWRRSRLVLDARLQGRHRSLPEINTACDYHQFDDMVAATIAGIKAVLPNDQLDRLTKVVARPVVPTKHHQIDKPWVKELKFGKWIAVAPGAGHQPKALPPHFVAKVLNGLAENLKTDALSVQLLYIGGNGDRELVQEVAENVRWPAKTLNLAGVTSLWETAIAISYATFLVTADSALLHIAEAVKTPVFAVFGPTVEAFGFSPWSETSRVYSAKLGCRPCSKHGDVQCRFRDRKCFDEVDIGGIIKDTAQTLRVTSTQ